MLCVRRVEEHIDMLFGREGQRIHIRSRSAQGSQWRDLDCNEKIPLM